jgi:holo-[acyl-carrier protein] synthase
MYSVGVDIIEISRIEEAAAVFGERFLNRIFTLEEQNLCRRRYGQLACRFAAKEAVMKALGTGIRGISWKEIEILSEKNGKPFVRLHGKARAKADSLELGELAISLSDSKEFAVAFVVAGKAGQSGSG